MTAFTNRGRARALTLAFAAALCLPPAALLLAGCPSRASSNADTDKRMRESFAKPLKVSDLPPEAQAIVKKGTPPTANAPR
jgi:hypothetical protein